MRYDELITALESIILNTDMTAPILKTKKSDTSTPVDLGMVAKDVHDATNDVEEQRIAAIAVQAVNKGAGHKGGTGAQRDTSSARVARNAHRGGKGYWSKDRRKNRGKGREKGGNCDSSFWWNCGAKGHNAVMCPKSGSKGLDAIHEGDEHTLEEVYEDDDEVHGVY